MTEALGKSHRPKVTWDIDWQSWLFGISRSSGANVWTQESTGKVTPRYIDIHLLEYPSFWNIHLGPVLLAIAGRVPKKKEWQ